MRIIAKSEIEPNAAGLLDGGRPRVAAGPETPLLTANEIGREAPEWLQRLVFEYAVGDFGCPERNGFLREIRPVTASVLSFDTVRRWAIISRIADPGNGLIALASTRGPDMDDFVFALVDLVCELRIADRFDIGWDGPVAKIWNEAVAIAPDDVRGVLRLKGGQPIAIYNACVALTENERDEERLLRSARRELLLAGRYGALNSEERQAVRTLAKTDLSVTAVAG